MVLRVFRHFVPVSVVLLAMSDVILLFIALDYYMSRNSVDSGQLFGIGQPTALPLALLIGFGMAASGLYHSKTFLDLRVMLLQIGVGFVFLCAILLLVRYWAGVPSHSSWDIEKIAGTWLVCILGTRAIFRTLVHLNVFKKPVLIVGSGDTKAGRIAELTATGSNRYFLPAAYLSAVEYIPAQIDLSGNHGTRSTISQRARQLGAREIVIATDDRRGLPMGELVDCRVAGIKVIDYLDFYERETKSVDLDALSPSWLIFSDGFRASRTARVCKRCFDVLLSALLLLLSLPLMLLTALMIVLDSAGPVLYRQHRVGLAGRQFVLLKFRSMHVNAEEDGAPRWALTSDPRATRVGGIIRKLRIDELPQLLNVLWGEMSFVGPRPERPGFVDEFTRKIPFYAQRHCVKPGITGWAQINYPYGASLEDARKKLSYDLYYVKNQSLFLDMVIALQTVRVILWAEGAR